MVSGYPTVTACDFGKYGARMLIDQARYRNGHRIDFDEAQIDGDFVWIGLSEARPAELERLAEDYSLDPLAVEDTLSGKQRPKLDEYSGQTFLLLKTVAYDPRSERVVLGDVSLYVSPMYVIAVRHGEALPLKSVRAQLEANPKKLADGSTSVVHEVVDRLVDQYMDVSAHLLEDVEQLEDSVFDDEVPSPASRLYFVKREVIEFRRAVLPLVAPLTKLAEGKVRYIDPKYSARFADVRDHLLKVMDEIEFMNDLIDAALHANAALIQVNQNEDMRKISAWVGIGAVPTMVAGIYGMNFEHMPELGWKFGYPLVLVGLTIVCGQLFRTFRRNRWL
jgi:magnesium transporter